MEYLAKIHVLNDLIFHALFSIFQFKNFTNRDIFTTTALEISRRQHLKCKSAKHISSWFTGSTVYNVSGHDKSTAGAAQRRDELAS